jgi:adenosylcobinamide kinase/adenosylcobinamide-phosphate guanylyltransferase
MGETTGPIVLIIGGAKSGKSSFALERANAFPGKKAYVATAEALDEEMSARIEKHKAERGKDWVTIEEPGELSRALHDLQGGYGAVIVDCLTLWLTNLLLGADRFEGEIEDFLTTLKRGSLPALFIVSNEVGMGIVPDNALSRRFRDLAGAVNQKVAAVSDEVYLVTAGIPVRIKPWP